MKKFFLYGGLLLALVGAGMTVFGMQNANGQLAATGTMIAVPGVIAAVASMFIRRK